MSRFRVAKAARLPSPNKSIKGGLKARHARISNVVTCYPHGTAGVAKLSGRRGKIQELNPLRRKMEGITKRKETGEMG